MRKLIAITLAKLVACITKTLNLGSGSALPGRLALAIYPTLLEDFKTEINRTIHQKTIKAISVVITGTNGKTTTTGLLEQMLRDSGYQDISCNHQGANLYYGVVNAFIMNTTLSGKLKSPHYIIEADEAALAAINAALKPKIIIITNLFRDQLDRFGELDSTQKLISKGIEASYITEDSAPALVLNADDKRVYEIAKQLRQRHLFTVSASSSISNLDLQDTSYKAHTENSETLTSIQVEHEGLDGSDIRVSSNIYDSENYELHLRLPGLYNAYNFAAASTAAKLLGLSPQQIKSSLDHYHCNFGRAEVKTIKGVEVQTFLIKNPTGCTEVLKLLENNSDADFMVAINDNYADGRDVSWLWDAEWQRLSKSSSANFTCSGHRAEDMALRLDYAGIAPERITTMSKISQGLKQALTKAKNRSRRLYILPTYTSLLELEKL